MEFIFFSFQWVLSLTLSCNLAKKQSNIVFHFSDRKRGEKERKRDRERDRDRERETETERERQADRETEKERQRKREFHKISNIFDNVNMKDKTRLENIRL